MLLGCSWSTHGHWKRQKNDAARMRFLSRLKVFSIAPWSKRDVQCWCFHCKSLATSQSSSLIRFSLSHKCHEASAEFTQKQMRRFQIKSAHYGSSLSPMKKNIIFFFKKRKGCISLLVQLSSWTKQPIQKKELYHSNLWFCLGHQRNEDMHINSFSVLVSSCPPSSSAVFEQRHQNNQ